MNSRIEQLQFFHSSSFKQARKEFDSLVADPKLKKAILGSFLLVFIACLFPLVFLQRFPPQLPLFYSRPWGKTRLVSKNKFIFFPLITLILSTINLRLASIFFKKLPLLSRLIIWTNLIVNFLTAFGVLKIISITAL